MLVTENPAAICIQIASTEHLAAVYSVIIGGSSPFSGFCASITAIIAAILLNFGSNHGIAAISSVTCGGCLYGIRKYQTSMQIRARLAGRYTKIPIIAAVQARLARRCTEIPNIGAVVVVFVNCGVAEKSPVAISGWHWGRSLR